MSHPEDTPEAMAAAPSRRRDASAGRVPPHDLGAEAAVLSAGLLDRAALDELLDELEPEHFYSDAHQVLFSAMARLRMAAKPVDVITLAHELREREQMQAVGGVRYLAEITDATPAIVNIVDHCRIVREAAQRRNVIAVCQRIAAEGYGDVGEHEAWIQDAERRVFESTRGANKREPAAIGPLVVAEYEAAKNPDSVQLQQVETGFSDYDHEIGGFYRGELIIIAARPGMGKSALMQCLAVNVAKQKSRVVPGELAHENIIFSLEMPKTEVAQRFLSQGARVSLSQLRDRGRRYQFELGDWQRLANATAELEPLPIWVDDTPGIPVSAIVSKMRRWDSKVRQRGRRVGFFAIDYLQKVRHLGRTSNRDEMIGEITGALKNAAMELDVPVLLLSQLNRNLESRPANQKRPLLSDLRESGNIEQDADQIVFVYRPHYYDTKKDPSEAEAIVAKNRNGPTGTIPLRWIPKCARFVGVNEHV